MARRTITTCDNCGADCTDDVLVVKVEDKPYDVCPACVRGNMVLEPPVSLWPKWVPREAVHSYLKELEKGVTDNITDVKKMRKELKRMSEELLSIHAIANRENALKDPWSSREALKEIAAIGQKAARNGE